MPPIYKKQKEDPSSLCILDRYYCLPLKYLNWFFICCFLVSLWWDYFKFMLLKTLHSIKVQCYIIYCVYVTLCKESAQDPTSACKLYIIPSVLCFIRIYLTWNVNFHICFCYGHFSCCWYMTDLISWDCCYIPMLYLYGL